MTAILETPVTEPVEPVLVVGPPPARPARPAPPAAPRARRPRPALSATRLRLLGLSLVGLYVVGLLLEPPANGPDPVPSAWIELLATVQLFLMVAAIVGFVRARRWSLRAALGFTSTVALSVALCPATGHHLLGAWWYGQVAVAVAMVALPAAALAGTRSGREAAGG